MQKFIMGVAVGVAVGTLIMVYNRSARELATAGKDFASQKLASAKADVDEKTEEIKAKTKVEADKATSVKPKAKRTKTTAKEPAKDDNQTETKTATK